MVSSTAFEVKLLHERESKAEPKRIKLLVVRHLFLLANIVPSSKALVPSSDALVPSSVALVTTSKALKQVCTKFEASVLRLTLWGRSGCATGGISAWKSREFSVAAKCILLRLLTG